MSTTLPSIDAPPLAVADTDTGARAVATWWRRTVRAAAIVATGFVAGAALGVVARWWMRLVTDDPEFSWAGTIFIVSAFALTGAGHGVAWSARRLAHRRRWITLGRVTGGVLTLPLFAGAGAIMLPTVVCAALARWRSDYRRGLRLGLALLAAPIPLFVVTDVWRHGVSAGRLLGLALYAATYVAVVASLRAVVAPVPDGWRMPRTLRVVLVTALALGIAFVAFSLVGLRG